MADKDKDGAETKEIVKEIDALTAFPIMVSDGYTMMTGAPTAPPTAPPGDLGATAQSAIKNVLGWNWRPRADPKGLVSALNTSFKAVPRQGRVDYEYQQRNYAVAVQADMGMITGAQASLYTRAKAIQDQMLVLISGFVPLLPDPDLSETEAIRSLVRTEITDVVAQFGAEGGPNVQLVDEAFTFLGGSAWTVSNRVTNPSMQSYDKIGGHLGKLGSAFGFEERWVNTIAQEQILTNFIVLVDYVNDLFSSWRANRQSFLVGSAKQPFMGTQLIQVSRSLAVVAEAVDQLCYVLGTVFIRKAEIQALELNYGGGQPSIFLGDLLDWIRNFVTSEGQQIINDSGKEGVLTFTTTARRLRDLVKDSKALTDVPAGYKTTRVQDALDNLVKQLDEAVKEAGHIRRYQPPSIEWVDVDLEDERLKLTLYGRNFSDRGTIALGFTRKGKPVISEVEKHGVFVEAFVSGASSATAIFDHKNMAAVLNKGMAELKKEHKEADEAKYALHVVIRNNDDQAAATVIRDDHRRVVLP
jgi:hypothetical protein